MTKEKLDTVKVTFKAFKNIMSTWNGMVDEDETVLSTKLGYAVKRFFDKNLESVFEEYNVKLSTIRIDHALTDEKTKALLKREVKKHGEREFEYDKEGLKATLEAERKLEKEWQNKEFDVTPFICKDLPELNEIQKEAFKGYVI